MKDNRRTQAERSAATRDALVAAGRALFAAHGYAEVSTAAIVRAAGVTRGALYHHFTDKSELFAAVFETVEAEVTGRIGAAITDSGLADPLDVMRLGARTWLAASAEPAIHRIVLLDAPAVLGWARWREIGNRHNMGLVSALLAHAIEVGRIRGQPVEPLAHTLLGAVREAALYLALADDPARAAPEVDAVVDAMIGALALG